MLVPVKKYKGAWSYRDIHGGVVRQREQGDHSQGGVVTHRGGGPEKS